MGYLDNVKKIMDITQQLKYNKDGVTELVFCLKKNRSLIKESAEEIKNNPKYRTIWDNANAVSLKRKIDLSSSDPDTRLSMSYLHFLERYQTAVKEGKHFLAIGSIILIFPIINDYLEEVINN